MLSHFKEKIQVFLYNPKVKTIIPKIDSWKMDVSTSTITPIDFFIKCGNNKRVRDSIIIVKFVEVKFGPSASTVAFINFCYKM